MHTSTTTPAAKTNGAHTLALAPAGQSSLPTAPVHAPVMAWLGDEVQDVDVLVWDRTHIEMSSTFVDDWSD
jgi:hypothetical protein